MWRMGTTRSALVLLWLAMAAPGSPSLEEARTALRAGRYETAREAFENEARQSKDPRAYRGWLEALLATGEYEEAAERAREFEREVPGSAELSNSLGEIYFQTGRIEEARALFERARLAPSTDALTARLNLAILLYENGEVEAAIVAFDGFIDVYNGTSSLSSEDLIAVGIACRYLGVTDPALYRDALKAVDEAGAKDPGNLEPKLLAGKLFLEKYNSTDAAQSFQEVLQVNPNHPQAILGLARVKTFDGSPEALELTEKALEINPNFLDARISLAEQYLSLENVPAAREQALTALELNQRSLPALTVLAAVEFLSGDMAAFEAAKSKVFRWNPVYADFYNQLADIAVQNRLYREAADFAQEAVKLDPSSWWGYGLLGLNQLRLGEIEAGRANLETSFEGDPFNVWIKNTLDLLDTYPDYQTIETESFEIFADAGEADALAPYITQVAELAYHELAERYQYRPQLPIRIEVYPSHADFSVRTIGLAGLGALGVCFGRVVVIDSPSARPRGQFNWASTLWHELAHTVTLGVTDHKVPRWFSEGLSVLEERRAVPGWGDDVNLPFLAAYLREELLPIAELNNGFVRPTSPQQIGISYYQASLVAELIERDRGFQAVRDVLDGYRRGLDTEKVFAQVLELSLSDFDALFATYLKERFGKVAATLRLPPQNGNPIQVTIQELFSRADDDDMDFLAQLKTGQALIDEGDGDKAREHLERAKELFPGYGGDDSPYWLLAGLYEKKGDTERAAEELAAFVDINENHYDAHMKLVELYQKLNKPSQAADILERALYIYPLESEPHRKLAKLSRELSRPKDVVREQQALLALTTDRAQGYYELALAHYEAGDRASARRELLRALELAPSFKQGLALLLKLRSEGGG